MKAEIICVGSELLLGEVINTNSAFISKELAKYGIDCNFQTVVGDNKQRIQNALNIALKRADILVFTGGLGPTQDDITIESIASYFKISLEENANAKEQIISYFQRSNRDMPGSNLKQALFPVGANVIANPAGTAPAMLWNIEDKTIIALPGVPSELYRIWESYFSEFFSKLSSKVIVSKNLKFAGISEALLSEKLSNFVDSQNPTVAPMASGGFPYVRLTVKSDNIDIANGLIDKTQSEILKIVSDFCYGVDDENIEHAIGQILSNNNLTLSVAESCTGGLISSRLTDVSGSSSYIKLNLTTYSNEAKESMLDVSLDTLKDYGAVSEQTASEMAKGIRNLANTDYALSITGIAGPTGATETKPVGLAYIAISTQQYTKVAKVNYPDTIDRVNMKLRFANAALTLLWTQLKSDCV